ncbi:MULTISPECIES: hypothetical protein [Rhizobium/Agrobacterium group]|uniref:hypothetical protein n=1 Tax=Rhizobium/Agrobacterium group TaxID=227290 RepID=UPI00107F2001|nr:MULTISPECIES: hypothetical protein [Rhizobium/Agrobacterium group]MBB4402564.1 hypothetical protein [Agrobacterium radiobacter]MBB5588718.1 hypothetical protein [Agrobacterium radiobacter]TGE89159.1 hypothetical protein C9418_12455 [Rhizobium sp. SEMIA 4032]
MSKFVIEKSDCLDSAARNLNDLLDVICQIQFECGPDQGDRRVDSLLWIARDMSEGIVDRTSNRSAQPATADSIEGISDVAGAEIELLSEIMALTAKFQRRRQAAPIEKAAMWLSEQPQDLPNNLGLLQNIFSLTAAQAAQALTLANQYRQNRRAFG